MLVKSTPSNTLETHESQELTLEGAHFLEELEHSRLSQEQTLFLEVEWIQDCFLRLTGQEFPRTNTGEKEGFDLGVVTLKIKGSEPTESL